MIYVTSDLHGCGVEKLEKLLGTAGFSEEDYLFILGDVIDRGEYGAQLLLWLTEQTNVQLILGNHEALMMACRFLFDEVTEESLEDLTPERLRMVRNWFRNGGEKTLAGLKPILKETPELMEGIWEYLEDAPLYERLEVNGREYLLVHGGLEGYEKGKPVESYSDHDLLWARPKLESVYDEPYTVIFGHTPTVFYGEEYAGRMATGRGWRNIDTGAACGGSPMLLRLEDEAEFYIES